MDSLTIGIAPWRMNYEHKASDIVGLPPSACYFQQKPNDSTPRYAPVEKCCPGMSDYETGHRDGCVVNDGNEAAEMAERQNEPEASAS